MPSRGASLLLDWVLDEKESLQTTPALIAI